MNINSSGRPALLLASLLSLPLLGAEPGQPGAPAGAPATAGSPAPAANWTAAQDHKNMMEQLGITKLRPGPSGRPDAPDAANYDEAKANPYPDLPDPLILNDGRKVTTAEQWWKQRRPEIIE